ncbi:hypothetical protein pb186bvf_013983 [Paramecium bursaria]
MNLRVQDSMSSFFIKNTGPYKNKLLNQVQQRLQDKREKTIHTFDFQRQLPLQTNYYHSSLSQKVHELMRCRKAAADNTNYHSITKSYDYTNTSPLKNSDNQKTQPKIQKYQTPLGTRKSNKSPSFSQNNQSTPILVREVSCFEPSTTPSNIKNRRTLINHQIRMNKLESLVNLLQTNMEEKKLFAFTQLKQNAPLLYRYKYLQRSKDAFKQRSFQLSLYKCI